MFLAMLCVAYGYTSGVDDNSQDRKLTKKEKKQKAEEERRAYEEKIVADSINGVYIPRNIMECFLELDKLLEQDGIETVKSMENRDEVIVLHMGLGMWVRNNWGLWGGSRLQAYLRDRGLSHPDDMSHMIFQFYYDWLNGINEGWQKFDT